MKIVMYGDSITDMGHREADGHIHSYGDGYPFVVFSKLCERDPLKHQVINKGISGDRTVDLYARIKRDVWNLEPDVLSILIGVNDIWHDLVEDPNGVELDRFERVYRMLIEDTLKKLPNIKIMLMEPFILHGSAVDMLGYDRFAQVFDYAKAVKRLSDEYGLVFVPLQEKFNEMAKLYGEECYLFDGVHPHVAGATLIANEWMKAFTEKVEK